MFGRTATKQLLRQNARLAHVSAAPPRQTSILGSIFGASKMKQVPLDQPYEATHTYPELSAPENASETTTLSNGLTIVSNNTPNPVAQIQITANTGSRYEDSSNYGINSFYAAVAQKATSNRSSYRYVRENAALGNTFSFQAGRENLVITATALQEHVAHSMGSLADILTDNQFAKADIYPAKDLYKECICEEQERNPDQTELIHAAAYLNNTLGNPLLARSHHLDSITTYSLQEHLQTVINTSNIVVHATGVEHAKLVDVLGVTFDSVPTGSVQAKLPAQYTGGDMKLAQSGEDGLVHFTLGFEGPGSESADHYALAVLEAAAASSLEGHSSIVALQCKSYVYSDSSLFTFSGQATPVNGASLSDFLVDRSLSLESVTEEQVALAKTHLVRQALIAGETNMDRSAAAAAVAGLEAVSTADVQRVATCLLQSRVSSAAHGNLISLPHQDQLVASFPTLLA